MHHVLAYSASVAAGATENDLAAVQDPYIVKTNGHFLLPQSMKLMMAVCVGTNLVRARLNSPTLRRIFLPYLWPLNNAATPPNDPAFIDYRDDPFTLPGLEEIECDTTSADAAAQQHTVALWVGDANYSYPVGSDIYTVRCTAAVTGVAYTWQNGPITFGQTLPAGEYAIMGAQVQSATGILARFILPGIPWRPGVIAVTSLSNRPPFQGDKRPLGVFGTFKNTALPSLEIFTTGADAAQVIHLDLAKIS